MHKFSIAATKSHARPVLHSVGLLNVLKSTSAGASVARLGRTALSSLHDENLCIVRASALLQYRPNVFHDFRNVEGLVEYVKVNP